MVNAEFWFQAGTEWDNFRTDGTLGGGGLMDVGSYCVSLALLVFGDEPKVSCTPRDSTIRVTTVWARGS